jgi:hypothetical protein
VHIRVSTADERIQKGDALPSISAKDADTVERFMRYWRFRSSIDSAFICHIDLLNDED